MKVMPNTGKMMCRTEYVRQCKFPKVSNKPCNVPQWLFYYWVISTVIILFHWYVKPPLYKGHK